MNHAELAQLTAPAVTTTTTGVTIRGVYSGNGFKHLANNEVTQITAALRVVASFQPMIRDRQRRSGGVRRPK